jgi:pyroglutamyl-peptidase
MTRVLLTSFEPFGGHDVNSSLEVGRVVSRQAIPGIEMRWLPLPVVARRCVEVAWEAIESSRPALVLALGQSAGARVVRVEDRAVNLDDFSIPDNAGQQPQKQWIIPGAPLAYRTTARLGRLLEVLREKGIAHEHSFHAGTYVCNHLYYGLLYRAERTAWEHQILFVHLPLLPGQVPLDQKWPSQPLEVLVEAVRQVIRGCVEG